MFKKVYLPQREQGNLEKELGPVLSTIKNRQCGNLRRTPE